MAVAARFKSFTTLIVRCYECPTLPILTYLYIILKQVRPSSKVLEIMSVNALRFVMLVIKWAPFCFEKEDKKIEVTGFDTWH